LTHVMLSAQNDCIATHARTPQGCRYVSQLPTSLFVCQQNMQDTSTEIPNGCLGFTSSAARVLNVATAAA